MNFKTFFVLNLFSLYDNLEFNFRIECFSPPSGSKMFFGIRILPTTKSIVKGHTLLQLGDVKSVPGGGVSVQCSSFPPSIAEILNISFPFAPTVFTDRDIDDNDYVAMVADGLPSILYLMRVAADNSWDQVKEYVKKPIANTGNGKRFPLKRKTSPTDASMEFHNATGTYTLSKFGTKKNIFHYIAAIPESMKRRLCISRANSTWDSYMCAWRCFTNFCLIYGRKPYIPVELDWLECYADYLMDEKELQYQTIKSYFSALKFLHIINNVDIKNFLNPRLRVVFDGIKNECLVLRSKPNYRGVITWSILRILSHCLAKSPVLVDHDRQVVWTLFLLAFFGAFRMGELLSTEQNSFDPFRAISWSKIRESSPDHYLVDILIPKVSEKPLGFVVDIFKYSGSENLCPISNLNRLLLMVKTKNLLHLDQPVFKLLSGTLLTPRFINNLLKSFLIPIFPGMKFTTHSFRAALPSHMATHPEIFTEEDAKLSGRWASATVRRYQRIHGIAQESMFAKLDNYLQVVLFMIGF